MPKKVSIADVLEMTPAERIELAEEIWDSVAASPESVPLTEAQRIELDRRLEAHRNDPTAGDHWDVVRARILRGK